jgi:hypothetical protein
LQQPGNEHTKFGDLIETLSAEKYDPRTTTRRVQELEERGIIEVDKVLGSEDDSLEAEDVLALSQPVELVPRASIGMGAIIEELRARDQEIVDVDWLQRRLNTTRLGVNSWLYKARVNGLLKHVGVGRYEIPNR